MKSIQPWSGKVLARLLTYLAASFVILLMLFAGGGDGPSSIKGSLLSLALCAIAMLGFMCAALGFWGGADLLPQAAANLRLGGSTTAIVFRLAAWAICTRDVRRE